MRRQVEKELGEGCAAGGQVPGFDTGPDANQFLARVEADIAQKWVTGTDGMLGQVYCASYFKEWDNFVTDLKKN